MSHNEILVISSFPPRKCGIATYSQDLIHALEDKFSGGFKVRVCALQNKDVYLDYPNKVNHVLKTWIKEDYIRLAETINLDKNIKIIYLQHEFGLYGGELGEHLVDLLERLNAPVITTFHTILAYPSPERKAVVQQITELSSQVIVMTKLSAEILKSAYQISGDKINVIPHGTHLIHPHKQVKREDVPFPENTILATFGLISEGKCIETAIEALPQVIDHFPSVLYLIIGKTHPEVLEYEGEKYREFLQEKVQELKIEKHVLFVNKYLSLPILLEYLERTDIYLFTSKDPEQAVSGTLAYAMSAGCPVISTPIPHALELLDGAGINFDFQNSKQLAEAAILMLSNPNMMADMRMNALHKISPTAWQNSAISHMELAKSVLQADKFEPNYRYPLISTEHVKRMTTEFGMLQFSKVAEPDITTGYTIDDNARALIALTKNFGLTGNFDDLHLINTYLEFILFCQRHDGTFLNYVTIEQEFSDQNKGENLEDANGRAIWALGEFLSLRHIISLHLQAKVEEAFQKSLPLINKLHSPRAIAFCIKGLYYHYQLKKDPETLELITKLADNLISKYRGVSNENWKWYEPYLTYANAVLPEAMLLAAKCTNSDLYKETAKESLDFLLSTTQVDGQFSVISNIGRHYEGQVKKKFGEQPIEIAYTVLALETFYDEYHDVNYLTQMRTAFNWFLGENHLHQIIYNPCTSGCYDGLEEYHVNLNQGAESTISYLLARLTLEKYD
ncbi:Glycosyltransferase involved in cell wall bisynthesis [Reichenbachiella agariperforans]|uniref:Glycosyltransferase involved in cell wall bisynthesis n=1 Tax=Reichenbachiella agariperforans TaxID=156994 RepID=A0A1M6JRS0_REIAG|nr:glycosyltransferase [Reichenbachiella agariperforans]SHJ49437.1 Glycosyltransferase involved in cell wall bisynthesis [Reichenbachiella agariperforans]